MRGLWKIIRYSSIAVFFTGILTTIAGCSNEDQIRALLLFLLLLLTGGGSEQPQEQGFPTGIVFDDFVINPGVPTLLNPGGGDCTTNLGTLLAFFGSPLFSDISVRIYSVDGSASGNSDFSFSISGSQLTMSASGGTTGCNHPNGSLNEAFLYWGDVQFDNNTDFSNISAIAIPVINVTGSVTGCRLAVDDSGNNLGVVSGFIDPSPPGMILSLSGIINPSQMNSIRLLSCNFAADSSLTIGPPLVVPK